MTCSIGFQAPRRDQLAQQVLQRMLEAHEADTSDPIYRDAGLAATDRPGCIPVPLSDFAAEAIRRSVDDPQSGQGIPVQ